jgi:hypothetical protein
MLIVIILSFVMLSVVAPSLLGSESRPKLTAILIGLLFKEPVACAIKVLRS